MAVWYSDHFSTDGTNQNTRDNTFLPPVGRKRGVVHRDFCRFKGIFLTTEVVRIATFTSSARIFEMLLTGGGESTAAGTMDIGLYLNDPGTTIVTGSGALFTSLAAKNAARIDAFTEAATLGNLDRGKQLWELVNVLVGSTFAADPMQVWDIVGICGTSFSVAANSFLLEIGYLAND